jgi:uncharacterized damage-inducible protein DinB
MSAFQEALQTGFEACLQTLKRAAEDLTPTEARWQPTDHTNHIAWLVWHMARVEDWWINRFLYERTEVWTADGWASRFGMAPEGNGAGQTIEEVRAMPEIPLSDLIAYFDAVRAVSRQYLAQVTEAALAQEYHHPTRGAMTGTGVLGRLLVEESQHVGQVALIRGMLRGFGA